MNPMELFDSVWKDPAAYGRRLKQETGRTMMGYFCSYAPEEIIYAAGMVPVRLFGTRGEITMADSHLQSYCCSLVRGGLESALSGSLDFLDGAVFPHTCDSIQRLSDIWRLNGGFAHHFDVVLPVKLNTPSARKYMKDVLSDFKKGLETSFGRQITNSDLNESIILFNTIRQQLKDVYEIRKNRPGFFAPSSVHRIVAASMIMERRDFQKNLSALLDNTGSDSSGADKTGRRKVVLSGGICTHPDIYEILAKAGADVVWDDLCTGGRYFQTPVSPDEKDPLAAIAERYLARSLCPAKHSGIESRGRELVEMVRQHKAGGVVFLLLKFCDPHAFDYPYLKQFLDDAGIPSLLLEIEDQPPPEGQLLTRLETFVDML